MKRQVINFHWLFFISVLKKTKKKKCSHLVRRLFRYKVIKKNSFLCSKIAQLYADYV